MPMELCSDQCNWAVTEVQSLLFLYLRPKILKRGGCIGLWRDLRKNVTDVKITTSQHKLKE